MAASTHFVAGDIPGYAAAVDNALANAQRAEAPAQIVHALTHAAFARALSASDLDAVAIDGAREYLLEAAKIEQSLPQQQVPAGAWVGWTSIMRALHAVWAEDLEEARHLFIEQSRRAAESGDDNRLAWVLRSLAELERTDGKTRPGNRVGD